MAIVHWGECTDKPRASITVSVGYAFMPRVYHCTLLVLVLTPMDLLVKPPIHYIPTSYFRKKHFSSHLLILICNFIVRLTFSFNYFE